MSEVYELRPEERWPLTVGGRRVPAAASHIIDDLVIPPYARPVDGLTVHHADGLTVHHRAAQVMFENGLVLSTIWGSMTYSSNNDHPYRRAEFIETPNFAEVAAWWRHVADEDRQMLRWPHGDTVLGYVDTTQWWRLYAILSVLPTGVEIEHDPRFKRPLCT